MIKSQKSIALIIMTLVLLSVFQMPLYSLNEYSDTGGHWAVAAIERWSDYGIIRGDAGEFRPDAPITRGEMACILDNIMKYETIANNSFSDLDESWYTDAVLKANYAGIMVGSAGNMRPKDNITRQEAAVLICRALGISESITPLTGFTDNNEIASWAVGYVSAMANAGYITGVGEKHFAPRDNITRAEAVTILDNAIKTIFQTASTYSDNVNGVGIVSSSGSILKDMTISGDLIISEGVGNGEVILDSVTVKGTLIIRGGGLNSIIIKNLSIISSIVVNRRDGAVAVRVDGDNAKVDNISVLSDGAVISAPKATVKVAEGILGTTVNGKAVQAGETVVAVIGANEGNIDITPTPTVTNPPSSGSNSNLHSKATAKPATSAPEITPTPTAVPTVPNSTPGSATGSATAIALDKAAATLNVAQTLQLNTILAPEDNTTVVTWESSDATIAAVDSTGLVMASAEGSVTITAATENGLTASCLIAVSAYQDLSINYAGTIINGGTYRNITITEAVDDGDVTFNDVNITGTLTVNGGGSDSIHFNGSSQANSVAISKASGLAPRFLLNDYAAIGSFDVSGEVGAILERSVDATGTVGMVNASKPLKIKGAVIPEINTSSNLKLENAEVKKVATTGISSIIELVGNTTLVELEAGAATTINADTTDNMVETIITQDATITTNDNAVVGVVTATGNASINVAGPTKHIEANGGNITVSGSSSPLIRGVAGTINIKGSALPVLAANASDVSVEAGNGAGVTVTGSVYNIQTTGIGNIGKINIENGNPSVTLETGTAVQMISISGCAAPTISGGGSSETFVSTSSSTVTVNVTVTKVVAENTEKVNGTAAQSVQQATVTLDSIDVTSYPTKLSYNTSDSVLNTAGLVVTGYYRVTGFDGTITKVMESGSYSLSGWPDTVEPGNYTITVTENLSGSDKTASFITKVTGKTVERIALTTLPATLKYELNGSIDLSGGIITVYYTDSILYPNVVIILPDDSVETGECDTATEGTKRVGLTYAGKTVYFSITIKDSIAQGLTEAKTAAEVELIQYAATKLTENTYSDAAKVTLEAAKNEGISAIKSAVDQNAVTTAKSKAKIAIDNVKTVDQESQYEIMVNGVGYNDLQKAITSAASGEIIEIVEKYKVSTNITIPTGKTVKLKANLDVVDDAVITVLSGAEFISEGTVALEASDVFNEETQTSEFFGSYLNINAGGTLSLHEYSKLIVLPGKDDKKANLNMQGTLNAVKGAEIYAYSTGITGVDGITVLEKSKDSSESFEDGSGVYKNNGTSWQKLDEFDLKKFNISIKSDGKIYIYAESWTGPINIQVDKGTKTVINKSEDGRHYIVPFDCEENNVHEVRISAEGKRSIIARIVYMTSGSMPDLKLISDNQGSDFLAGAFIFVAGNIKVYEEQLYIPSTVRISAISNGNMDLTGKELLISPEKLKWNIGGKAELSVYYGGKIILKSGNTIGNDEKSDIKVGPNSYISIGIKKLIDLINPDEWPDSSKLDFTIGGAGTVEIPYGRSFVLKSRNKMSVSPVMTLEVNGTLAAENGAIYDIISDGTNTGSVIGKGTGIDGFDGAAIYYWNGEAWVMDVSNGRANAWRIDVLRELYNNFGDGYGLMQPTAVDTEEYANRFSDWDTMKDREKEAAGFMVKNDIIKGNGEGQIIPYGDITRAELLIVFKRLVDKMRIQLQVNNPDVEFTDVSEEDFFYEGVMTMAWAGVVNGMPNEPEDGTFCFKPFDPVGIVPFQSAGYKNELQIVVERLKNGLKNSTVNRFDILFALYERLKQDYGLQTPSGEDMEAYATGYEDWNELNAKSFDEDRFSSLEEQSAENMAVIGFMLKNGIVNGMMIDEKVYIKPYNIVTRAEAMMLFDRVVKLVLKDENAALPDKNPGISFTDVEESSWFYEAVIHMAEAGVVSGSPNGTEPETYSFNPNGLLSKVFYEWGSEYTILTQNFFNALDPVF